MPLLPLLDGRAQSVVRDEVQGLHLLIRHWRPAASGGPLCYGFPFVRVSILCYHGLPHQLLRDRAHEKWRNDIHAKAIAVPDASRVAVHGANGVIR